MIPLVRDNDRFRKITHREIACLKRFPPEYILPAVRLYQNLMYAGNIFVVKQIAEMIVSILTDSPWRFQRRERGRYFENLFGRYLINLSHKKPNKSYAIESDFYVNGRNTDFILRRENDCLCVEVKHYSGRHAPNSGVLAVCEKHSFFRTYGAPILVLPNEVPDEPKIHCLKQFGVTIWDVANLI